MWEISFSAKTTSGLSGAGFWYRFRQCDENGAVTTTDASTSANITITDDGKWHSYRGYVTINDDAYSKGKTIVPRFGWAGSNEAGTVRVNGLTIRKVGDQWCKALGANGFTAIDGVTVETVSSADSPIAYAPTLKITNTTNATVTVRADNAQFMQWKAGTDWQISLWAKTEENATATFRYASSGRDVINTDGQWRLFDDQFHFTSTNLSNAVVGFELPAGASVYVNAPSIVPGTVVLANESHQNSAALKNVTVDTGTTLFNTAIEYDTDVNRTAYSRVKHYINNGEAYSYTYDDAGNIKTIQSPNGDTVSYEYNSLNQLKKETYSVGDGSPVPYTSVEYSYDSRGNLLSKTYSDGTSIAYGYNDTTWVNAD